MKRSPKLTTTSTKDKPEQLKKGRLLRDYQNACAHKEKELPMPNDTVASLLDDAIKRSGLSNQEVAERLGFEAGNMIELMRQGATQVPVRTLFHVPSVLDLDEKRFFRTFIQDCNGGLFSVQIEPDEILAPRVETIIRLMVYLTSQKDDEEWSKVAEIFDATLDLVRLSSART